MYEKNMNIILYLNRLFIRICLFHAFQIQRRYIKIYACLKHFRLFKVNIKGKTVYKYE